MQKHIIDKLALKFSSQSTFLEYSGDETFELLCDHLTQRKWSLDDAAQVLMRHWTKKLARRGQGTDLTSRTAKAYASAIIAYVRAEPGDEVIIRKGRDFYWPNRVSILPAE